MGRLDRVLAFVFLAPGIIFADTVKLKDGTLLTGRLSGQNQSSITLEIDGVLKVIPKSSIAAFREDDYGREGYERRKKEEADQKDRRRAEIDEQLRQIRAVVPTGFWITLAANRGNLYRPDEAILIDDRNKTNLLPGSGQSALFLPLEGGRVTGPHASAGYEGDRFFAEIAGASVRDRTEVAAVGIPALSAITNPGGTQSYLLGWLTGTTRQQRASASIGIEPVRWSSSIRLFVFAGKSGFNDTAKGSGPLLSNAYNAPSIVSLQFIPSLRSKISGSGPSGGIRLRIVPASRWELRPEIETSSFAGRSSQNITVIAAGSAQQTPSGTILSTAGGLWFREYRYALTSYYSLSPHVRIFAGIAQEETRIQMQARTNSQFPGDASLQNYFSPSRLGEALLRRYDHPRYSGRVRQLETGAEVRM